MSVVEPPRGVPTVTLVGSWGSEELIAAFADVIYRGYSIDDALRKVCEDPSIVDRRIEAFLSRGHHSVLEFAGLQWLVECSRACTHELVRHRIASYWMESQRYVDYSKRPLRIVAPRYVGRGFATHVEHYLSLRGSGVEPEDARYFLPNAAAARVWVQMNCREFFLNFIPLRTGLGAFHEVRLVAWLMFSHAIEKFPRIATWVWENLPRLHPDYCRNVDRFLEKFGVEDCRALSILDSFERWGVEVPPQLRRMLGHVPRGRG